MVELAVYALLAIFIFSRLYNSLGKASSDVAFPQDVGDASKRFHNAEVLVADHSQDLAIMSTVLKSRYANSERALAKIKEKDKNFSLFSFMQGAEMAFDLIIKAFDKNDLATLTSLLEGKLLASFKDGLDKRQESGEIRENTVISVQTRELLEIRIVKNTAFIAVRFISEQINFVKNQAAEVVSGSISKINKVEDIWQFKRDVTSSSPKWLLNATNYQVGN